MAWLNDPRVQGFLLGAGGVLVWGLALFVASRAPSRRAPVLAALAMLCLAAYLTGEALGALAPGPDDWSVWLRRTWWAPCFAAPAWLTLTLALAADEGPAPLADRAQRFVWPIGSGLFVSGAVLALVGMATNLVQDWPAAYTTTLLDSLIGSRRIPPGPLLPLFQVFVLLCLVGAAALLAFLWRRSPTSSPLRARFAWLTASAFLFLLGGTWIVVGSGVYGLVGLPGQTLLVIGMLILGWNMARYGALLAGEVVQNDFRAFATTMAGIVVLYGSVLLLLAPDHAWLERGLPLLLVIMTTHVLVDTRGHLLDRLLYAPLIGTLRGQLRDLGNRVVRQPDELTALVDVRETIDQILRDRTAETEPSATASDLRVLVEGALRRLNDLPSLSEHPLLDELPSLSAGAATPLERAARVRNALDQAIERLRPTGARPGPGAAALGGWLHYLVLKEAYVDGRPNKQIMQRYALSESTFHRARRRAIDALTAELRERTEPAAASHGA
jgi:hypothetical protein